MPAPLVPTKVSVAERTRGSKLRPPLISPSAVNSTKQLVASDWTADSLTSAPIALPVVTPNPLACEKQGRELANDSELRGKHPCYMHFIFRVGDIRCTPSATYMESVTAIPDIPTSDYRYTEITSTILSYPHLFPIITPIKTDHFKQSLHNHPNMDLVHSVC